MDAYRLPKTEILIETKRLSKSSADHVAVDQLNHQSSRHELRTDTPSKTIRWRPRNSPGHVYEHEGSDHHTGCVTNTVAKESSTYD